MQAYDLVMIVVLAGAVLFGAWKGLAWQVASLAAVFASYVVAMNFYQPVAQMINTDEPWNKFLAMLILYIGSSLAIWVTFGFVRSFIEKMALKDFDRHVGALLGAVKGALLCILITIFGVTLLGETQTRTICNSRSGGYIAKAINRLVGFVPPEIHTVVGPYIDRFHDAMDQHREDVDDSNPPLDKSPLPNDSNRFWPNASASTSNPSPTQPTNGSNIQSSGSLYNSAPPFKPPIRRW
jgi:membrane protein required for colicin V production